MSQSHTGWEKQNDRLNSLCWDWLTESSGIQKKNTENMKSCKILGKEEQRIGRQQIYNIKDQPTPRSRSRLFPRLIYDCLFRRDSLRMKRIFVWPCSIVVPATHCMYSPINKCCRLWSCFSCLQTWNTQAKATQRWKTKGEMSFCKREIYFHLSSSY